jgi:L-alanine-DL-glutamate epimerase-like enolase superfamily enzyme
MVRGMLTVPRGPGIGVSVDEDAIAEFSRRNTLVNAL